MRCMSGLAARVEPLVEPVRLAPLRHPDREAGRGEVDDDTHSP